MKKLFISCPMKERTEENIKKSMDKMHKLAEVIFDEQLEVIPTYIKEEPPEGLKNPGIWYLGKSIELLAEADYFIGIHDYDCYNYSGCTVEVDVARRYGIRFTLVDLSNVMDEDEVAGGCPNGRECC